VTAVWIDLEGAANVRDLGGLPLRDGGVVASGSLIRSDNLQGLSPRDVRLLVDDLRVRAVADLRTGIEVASEGPGPLTAEPDVRIVHASLFVEDGPVALADTEAAGPIVLPWQQRSDEDRRNAAGVYLGFIVDRPDSILAALRLIAHSDGATIVHCAAGKDRTGTVVALALDAVGVPRDAIIDDYARTAERLPGVMARLAASPTYSTDIREDYLTRSAPRPDTMRALLEVIDTDHGGVLALLTSLGWTDADQQALVAKLSAAG
jgi:protein-tyrosine phosphatase